MEGVDFVTEEGEGAGCPGGGGGGRGGGEEGGVVDVEGEFGCEVVRTDGRARGVDFARVSGKVTTLGRLAIASSTSELSIGC